MKYLFLLSLLGVIALAGCTASVDVSSVAKQLPAVQEFLNQHPDAEIKALLLSSETVQQNIDEITKACGGSLPVKSYWKVELTENNNLIIVYLEPKEITPVCISRTKLTESGEVTNALPVQQTTAAVEGLEVTDAYCLGGNNARIVVKNIGTSSINTNDVAVSRTKGEGTSILSWDTNSINPNTGATLNDPHCATTGPATCIYVLSLPSGKRTTATTYCSGNPNTTETQPSQISTNVAILCKDSDGGKNYYTKGYGTGIYVAKSPPDYYIVFGQEPDPNFAKLSSNPYDTYYDYCVGDQLNEAYCQEDGKLGSIGIKCENGCENGACLKSSVPSVKLLSPNGGEKWVKGEVYNIQWSSTGIENVTIFLADFREENPTWYRISPDISATLPRYSWKVADCYGSICDFTLGNQYKIKVVESATSTRYPNLVEDSTDDYFSISSSNTSECVRKSPGLSISSSRSASAGKSADYEIQITNNDNSACGPSVFYRWGIFDGSGIDYVTDQYAGTSLPKINPGETLSFNMTATSKTTAPAGESYKVGIHIENTNAPSYFAEISGILIIAGNVQSDITHCVPTSYNFNTGEIKCDSWTNVKTSLASIDGVTATISDAAPASVIKVFNNDYQNFYAKSSDDVCLKVLADLDNNGVYETLVKEKCFSAGNIQLYTAPINAPVLYTSTKGVVYADYIGPNIRTLFDGESMKVSDLTLKVVQSFAYSTAKLEIADSSGNAVKSSINTGATESVTYGGVTYNYKVLSSGATTSSVLGYAEVFFGKT